MSARTAADRRSGRTGAVSPQGGAQISLLRQLNTSATLAALMARSPLSVSEVAGLIGVTRKTAEEALLTLAAGRWVRQVESPAPRRMGRPARRFAFDADAGHVVGIEIARDRINAVGLDMVGVARVSGSAGFDAGASTAGILEAVDRALAEVNRASPPQPPLALGVGCSGIVTAEGVVSRSVRVPGLQGVDLGSLLRGRFGVPVLVENDCRAAAAAERRLSAAEYRSAVHVSVGARLGCAIVIDNELLTGAHGAAGEVGALAALGWSEVEKMTAEGADWDAAAVGQQLALGVAAIVTAVDPEVVVLDGAGRVDSAPVADELARQLALLLERPVRVVLGRGGPDSVALGSGGLALDGVYRRLLDPEDSARSLGSARPPA